MEKQILNFEMASNPNLERYEDEDSEYASVNQERKVPTPTQLFSQRTPSFFPWMDHTKEDDVASHKVINEVRVK
jgi:hypothetical protein